LWGDLMQASGQKPLKKNSNGEPLPQEWDELYGDYRVHTGSVVIQNGLSVRGLDVGVSPVDVTNGLSNRRKLIIRAIGDNPVYLGSDTSVTKDSGYPLLPGEEMNFTFNPLSNIKIYAVAETSQSIRVMEIN
jgi:hypothetical protein